MSNDVLTINLCMTIVFLSIEKLISCYFNDYIWQRDKSDNFFSLIKYTYKSIGSSNKLQSICTLSTIGLYLLIIPLILFSVIKNESIVYIDQIPVILVLSNYIYCLIFKKGFILYTQFDPLNKKTSYNLYYYGFYREYFNSLDSAEEYIKEYQLKLSVFENERNEYKKLKRNKPKNEEIRY